jgi:hypothetical protein
MQKIKNQILIIKQKKMKKSLFTTIVFIVLIVVYAFTPSGRQSSPATVSIVSDVPLFIFSEPVADYEIVGKALSVGNMIKLAVDEESTVEQKAEDVVAFAMTRKEKGKVPEFDALILDLENEKAHTIKFKGEVSLKATIKECEEVPVFLFATPDDEYEVVAELPADYSSRAQRNGMLYDKIKSMINRTLKKEEAGEVKQFDAVIIDPKDLSETLIKFK